MRNSKINIQHQLEASCVRRSLRQRGSAMVEMAVVLPLLLVTTIGLVDFGRAAFEAIEVENAAHAGASYGARSKSTALNTTGIQAAALADMGDEVDTSGVTVASSCFCECDNGSSIACDLTCGGGVIPLMYVKVNVQKQFQTLINYPGIPHTVNLARQVQLRVR